jgi:hypothetical protein
MTPKLTPPHRRLITLFGALWALATLFVIVRVFLPG